MANRIFLRFLLLLLLTLVLLGGFWFVQNFERSSEEVRSGFSSTAQRNPWLAAERFLHRLGMQVESLSGREYLLAPPLGSGVLLVRDLGPSLPIEREERLLEWVAVGNHLVIASARVPAADEPNNPLLERFGVSLHEIEQPDQEETVQPVPVELPGAAESIRVAFDPTRSLRMDAVVADWQVPAASGYHLLRFKHGVGSIVVLSDNLFLSNREIDEQDHALLLARLVNGAARGWLLYSSQMPSLLQLIWQHAAYLLISACLALLALLWWFTQRTGPLLAQVNPARRDLLEHLQASAEFLWQQDRASGLQGPTRRQVEKRWLQRHPLLERLDQEARCEWLAERTGPTPQMIKQALYTEQADEQGLIRASAILQRLHAAPDTAITMEQPDGR